MKLDDFAACLSRVKIMDGKKKIACVFLNLSKKIFSSSHCTLFCGYYYKFTECLNFMHMCVGGCVCTQCLC